jgi:hypothetical protein
VGSRRWRNEGAELKGENKRDGGAEGAVGGRQCGNVTLPHLPLTYH